MIKPLNADLGLRLYYNIVKIPKDVFLKAINNLNDCPAEFLTIKNFDFIYRCLIRNGLSGEFLAFSKKSPNVDDSVIRLDIEPFKAINVVHVSFAYNGDFINAGVIFYTRDTEGRDIEATKVLSHLLHNNKMALEFNQNSLSFDLYYELYDAELCSKYKIDIYSCSNWQELAKFYYNYDH